MCFSATASFVTAAVTGTVGLLCLTRVRRPGDTLLAAMPLVFAAQQAIEGLLWLKLPFAPEGEVAHGLTVMFLVFADSFWPIYAPLAVLLVEPDRLRRRLIAPWVVLGAALAAYLLWGIFSRPDDAVIIGRHIVYSTAQPHPYATALIYIAVTSLPLLISSQRVVAVLGAIVFVGCAVSYVFYLEAFVSVWCFFAAAASAVILGHFQLAYGRGRSLQPA